MEGGGQPEAPRRFRYRTVRALVPVLRAGGGNNPARRDTPRAQPPSHHRKHLQGDRAGSSNCGRNRPAQGRQRPSHPGDPRRRGLMAEKIAIVDYGAGNLRSVANALAVAAGTRAVNVVTTGAPEEVRTADRVLLPGVGAFAIGRAN